MSESDAEKSRKDVLSKLGELSGLEGRYVHRVCRDTAFSSAQPWTVARLAEVNVGKIEDAIADSEAYGFEPDSLREMRSVFVWSKDNPEEVQDIIRGAYAEVDIEGSANGIECPFKRSGGNINACRGCTIHSDTVDELRKASND